MAIECPSTANGTTRAVSEVQQEQGDQSKGTADTAHAAIWTQSADEETVLEVDIMILDYIAYRSTNACLTSRQVSSSRESPLSLEHDIRMTNAFFTSFRSRHRGCELDAELRFRMLLLKLVTLFTQRLTRNVTTPPRDALRDLRAAGQERVKSWIGSADRIPTVSYNTAAFDEPSSFPTPEELERNRAHVLHELGMPAEDEAYEDAFYGSSSCVALLDLLPLFMQVSAARNAIGESNLTEVWMEMACEFMLQACLEQYLVVGAHGTDAMDEAFAWGYRERSHRNMDVDGEEEELVDEVNDMFEDATYETEVEGWRLIKASRLDQLFPRGVAASSSRSTHSVSPSPEENATSKIQTNLTSDLELVAAKHPIVAFEDTILTFLGALADSISKPVLVQLECGQLEGMSEQETRDFLASCGLNLARFFEETVGFKAAQAANG